MGDETAPGSLSKVIKRLRRHNLGIGSELPFSCRWLTGIEPRHPRIWKQPRRSHFVPRRNNSTVSPPPSVGIQESAVTALAD